MKNEFYFLLVLEEITVQVSEKTIFCFSLSVEKSSKKSQFNDLVT